MNARAFLKRLLMVAVLAGLLWLWWQFTTPHLPLDSIARSESKSLVVSRSTPKPLTEKVAEVEPSTDVIDSVPSNPVETSIQSQPNMPAEVFNTLPLNQAGHYVFSRPVSGLVEVSIRDFRHDSKGNEWVDFHVWRNEGVAHITDAGRMLSTLPIEDQNNVRNWVLQQAAANPSSTSRSSTGWLTTDELAQQADRLGISRSNPDWEAQVQAQLNTDAAWTRAVDKTPGASAAAQSKLQQQQRQPPGPSIILN